MNSFCCGGHQAEFVAIPKRPQCFVASIAFVIISALPAAKIIAANTSLPTSLPTENVENVYSVTPNSAGLGDHIEMEAGNLYEWLKEANSRRAKRNLPIATVYDLVLFINGVPFKGLHPDTYREERPRDEDKNRGFREINYLGFQLSESDAAKSAWQGVLNRPVFSRPVTLTVGFVDAPDILMDTVVLKDAQDEGNQFNLIIVRAGWQLNRLARFSNI